MIPLLFAFVIFASSVAGAAFALQKQATKACALVAESVAFLNDEVGQKNKLFETLQVLQRESVPGNIFEEMKEAVAKLEAQFAEDELVIANQGAECTLLQLKIDELMLIVAEYEKSSERSKEEYEQLSQQEAEANRLTEELRNKLQSTFVELDVLLADLAETKQVTEAFAAAKSQLSNIEEKVLSLEAETSMLQKKYFELKQAYDALDLEYAQLYERQSALATNVA